MTSTINQIRKVFETRYPDKYVAIGYTQHSHCSDERRLEVEFSIYVQGEFLVTFSNIQEMINFTNNILQIPQGVYDITKLKCLHRIALGNRDWDRAFDLAQQIHDKESK